MKKKVIAAVLAALCITGAGIYTTISYSTDSQVIENTIGFVSKNGLAAKLEEPSWDPAKGLLVIPGQTLPKDPQVTNTSEANLNEIVALKAEFVYSNSCPDASKRGKTLSKEDMKSVSDCFNINYDADGSSHKWVRFTGESKEDPVQRFYYDGVLKRNLPGKGDTTKPLFTEVSVPSTVSSSQYSKIQEFGGFDIVVSGHVIQQLNGETQLGIGSAAAAYSNGLFDFNNDLS